MCIPIVYFLPKPCDASHSHTYGSTHVHPLSHLLLLCHTLRLRGGYLLRHDGICGGGNAGSLLSPTVRACWIGRREGTEQKPFECEGVTLLLLEDTVTRGAKKHWLKWGCTRTEEGHMPVFCRNVAKHWLHVVFKYPRMISRTRYETFIWLMQPPFDLCTAESPCALLVWPTLWHSYLDRSAHTSGNRAKAFIFLKRKSERPVEESVVLKREGGKNHWKKRCWSKSRKC